MILNRYSFTYFAQVPKKKIFFDYKPIKYAITSISIVKIGGE
jgi:hypothetical protein